jgi:hypothetical protein
MPPKDQQQTNPPTDTDVAEPLTTEVVEKLVNEKLNAALSSHMTRFKGSLSKELEATIAKAVGPLSERFEQLQSSPSTQPANENKPAAEAERLQKKHDAEMAALRAQVESRNAELDKERKQRLENEERSTLSQALAAAGVTNTRGAIALLYTEDKRLARNDKGEVVFKVQKAGFEDFVPVDEGLADWFKTDEGKSYLPPRGAAGSGAVPSGGGRPGGTKDAKADRKSEAKRLIAEYFGKSLG